MCDIIGSQVKKELRYVSERENDMVRGNKTKTAKFFSLLAAVILCFTVFTVPVSAEDNDESSEPKEKALKLMYLQNAKDGDDEEEPEAVGPEYNDGTWNHMHFDMRVFDRNYALSPELKEYTIRYCEDVLSVILTEDMSDLEKYYTLALWLNKHVNYDWNFWPGGYDLAYYSHQWDSYGVLEEQESICAGIAVTYAVLCHAADLPCKFLRMQPSFLDHTINYIPDINGHPFFIDVTEDLMFMSKESNPWEPLDYDFARIKKMPNDSSLEYYENGNFMPSTIKPYYYTPFDEWYREYALHEDTDKVFPTPYTERGSGKSGRHYASYEDYPTQFSNSKLPTVWFLEDFYNNPKELESKIKNNELDEQLLNITGVKGSYDCSEEELAAAVESDIEIRYFPTSKNDKVVAKAANLTVGEDYTVSCSRFDEVEGVAELTIKGAGKYRGEHTISVSLGSAAVTKEPVTKMDLDYTGEDQELVEPGKAENGTILYAARPRDESKAYPAVFGEESATNPIIPPDSEDFSEKIPTSKDVGKFEIWYRVDGDDSHSDVPARRLETASIIAPLQPKILIDNVTVKVGEKIKLSPELDEDMAAVYNYLSFNDDVATVGKDGTVKGIGVGTTTVIVGAELKDENANCKDPDSVDISIKVTKGNNPLKVTAKTAKVKYSKLKKKAQTIKRAKLITVSKKQGTLKYKLVSVKKGNKSFKKYFKINAKTGNVTVKKGLKKGTYKVKVQVKSVGNANYKPSSWKSVTSKVRVK